MEKITFIPINKENLEYARDIYNYYVVHSTATFHTYPLSTDQFGELLPLGHPKYGSFLIRLDGKLAGYCFVTQFKNRNAYDRSAEVTVYLKPEFIHKGIGLESLKYLETIAKEKGIKVLLGVISGDNKGSIQLFKKAGYQKCAHYKQVGEKFGQVLDVVAYQKII